MREMGPGLSLGASDLARPLLGPRCQPVKAGLARGPCSDTPGSPGLCSLYQGPASRDSSPGHLSRGAFGSLVAALSRNRLITGPPAPLPHRRGRVREALGRGGGRVPFL